MLSFLKGKKDKEKAGRKLSASSNQAPTNGKHGSSETTDEIDDHTHHELLEEDDDVIKPGTVLNLVSQFAPTPTGSSAGANSATPASKTTGLHQTLPPPITLKPMTTSLKSPNITLPLSKPGQTSKLKSILRGDPTVLSAYEPSVLPQQPPKITVTVTKPVTLRSPQNGNLLQVAPQMTVSGAANGALSPSLAIPSAPTVMPLPPLPVRASAIRRLPRGDFGIILRQGMTLSIEEPSQRLFVRTVVFAEPNVVTQNQPLTLLPGDELLEVGETSVCGWSRDDIVNLFRRANDTVVLRFQQAPEFREISLNFFSDNVSVSSDAVGRVRRGRGSAVRRTDPVLKVRRFSSASSMGNDGTDDRTKVWLNHERGFCMARQITNESDDYVTVEVDGTQLGVRQANLFPRNPLAQNFVADLSRLSYLNEPAILNTLIQRFSNGLCHNVAGTSSYLVSLTPMRPMYCYSEKVFRMFNWTDCCDELPHPFSLAANVLSSMQKSRQDQTIVFLGLSGSGKSALLRNVAAALIDPRATSAPCAVTPGRLNAALTVLDAFGSCSIGSNPSSSRYALLASINYDQQGRPLGVVLTPNFLDRYRVANRGDLQQQPSSPSGSDSYSNFGVFYHLLAGICPEDRAELMLDVNQQSSVQNVLVEMTFATPQLQKAHADKWTTLTNCLDELNISGDERRGIWRTIGAIIHLGFAGFVHTPTGAGQFYRLDSAQRAADLLGVKVEDLSAAVFSASRQATGTQSAPGSRNSTLNLNVTNTSQAAFRAFVSGLYAHLFAAVTALINRRLTTHSNRAMYTIHLLDTPGLQRVGDLNGASFMDFCYNYITERLLGLYVGSAFTSPLDAFVQEDVDSGLELNLDVPLDSNRTLLDTFDGRDQSSLFWLLDQEILSPTGSDDGFLNRLFTAAHDRFRSSTASIHQDGFQLVHAFGQFPINYRVAGWMAAMTEHHAFYTSADLLRTSISPSVGAVFSAILDLPAGSSILRPPSIRRSPCLAMKCQVDQFLEPLRRTKHHFSLSILTSAGKPVPPPSVVTSNNPASPSQLSQLNVDVTVDFVRAQFRALSIEELVKLQKYGCTESFRYTDFVRSFRLQLPTASPLENDDPRLATTLILQSATIEQRSFRFGKNRIFLCREALQELECLREERLGEVVVKLQALCRAHLARKRCERLRVQHAAARCIQKNVAKWGSFREWPWWRLYVRIKPLINVHKTEEELRSRQEEAVGFRQKFERSENEKSELMQANAKLEFRIKQLETVLAEQTAAQQQASDMLETETLEKQKLLTEVSDIKKRLVKQAGSPALMASSMVAQQQSQPSPSPLAAVSAVLDTRLANERDEFTRALEERAEAHKCRALKLGAELQDVRYELEQTRTALADLERRVARSDTDISSAIEDSRRERVKGQHLQQECDGLKLDRGRMENEIIDLSESKTSLEERVSSLQAQISALTATALPESLELASLRRKVDELTLKCKDQEEELDEQAGDIQMLQASKLNLQMQLAQTSQALQKVQEEKDSELQDVRAALLRRARAAEQQLEEEQTERQKLAREKRQVEAQLNQLQSEQAEIEERRVLATERRLRNKLAATRALLQAAQLTISRLKASGDKNQNADIRMLEERAEDAEQKAARLAKAKQRLESDLAAMNEEMARLQVVRSELEKRCAALSKEKGDLEDQIGEHDDELTEANDKLRTAIAERSVDKVTVDAQAQEIIKLEERLQASEERCSALETRLELFQARMIDKQEYIKLEMQTRTLEGYLQLERAERSRLETALERAKQKAENLAEAVGTFEELLRNERQRSARLEKDLNSVTEEAQDNARRLTDVESKLGTLTTEASQLQKMFEDREEQLHLAYQNITTMQKALEEKASSSADEDEDEDDFDDDGCMFEALSQTSAEVTGVAPSGEEIDETRHENGLMNGNGHASSACTTSYSSDSVINQNESPAEERPLANGQQEAVLAG